MEHVLRTIKKLLPKKVYTLLQHPYHRALALIAACIYRFPSKKIKIVAVTGTKGKTTTSELVAALLTAAGYKVGLSNTYRFVVGDEQERNMHKLTMPGRFFVQKFLRKAVDADCDWVVFEMTSEGVRQFRHTHVELDALIFTNLSPEHIESHGSYENYRNAKRKLGLSLAKSSKKNKVIVANADDKEGTWYLSLPVDTSAPFTLRHAEPYTKQDTGYTFTFRNTRIDLPLPGVFNLYNALAAATFAASVGVDLSAIKQSLESFTGVRGRVEFIQREPFPVVVDNAHTTDSLEKFYKVFNTTKNICVLGKMGGGRDTWSRKEMAHIADLYCERIILTNEDPVDEDPMSIVEEMATAIETHKYHIIMDRREAIREALRLAGPENAVLITGKGTDPFILGPNGTRIPWDDAAVTQEELQKLHQ